MKDESRRKLQTLLIEARTTAKLTQSELSLRLKKPQSFVSKYERGERRLDVIEIREVVQALGVDPIRFLKRFYGEIS